MEQKVQFKTGGSQGSFLLGKKTTDGEISVLWDFLFLSMGNGEIATPSKAGKASSSVLEHTNVHPYSDWAAMQAYYGYGAGVTMAPPYFNTAVTPGHAPHPYMWGPQLVMPPPFGTPYPAIYPPGGVYSQLSEGGHGTVTLPTNILFVKPLQLILDSYYNGLSICGKSILQLMEAKQCYHVTDVSCHLQLVMQETTVKSTNDKDSGILKKRKGPDGLVVSVSNGSDEKEARSAADAPSQSTESETKGSSSGSDKNNMETGTQSQTQSKRSTEDTASGKSLDSDTITRMKLRVSSAKQKIAPQVSPTKSTFTPNPDVAPPGQWIQASKSIKTISILFKVASSTRNFQYTGRQHQVKLTPLIFLYHLPQNEREMKRERRKQSNRESARRSRLRKQAETEELAQKVESLSAEKLALKSEISQLSKDSAKLRQENSSLMDKLKNTESSQKEDSSDDKMEAGISPSAGTENLLSKIA
ncbi:hypothetical protein Taro_025080 [Colocasia esculenta]|uniref:BZIP domain-containing protein n=1 Tax=Colocasia esculenta TaxID=4460 RepID=A0A843VB91_COLES|nr:hypothetical protein [Colocasia esculenta]